jgi:hypothetical protein
MRADVMPAGRSRDRQGKHRSSWTRGGITLRLRTRPALVLPARVPHAVICPRNLAGGGDARMARRSVAYLRGRLAGHPAKCYRTCAEAVAGLHELQAGR